MFDRTTSPTFLDQLNPEQRAAATHSGESLLIVAGAGTGKTTTLCSRAAWLMAEGAPAERILLLTFTRRAAGEMVERARTLAERVAPDAGRIVGGTFHSIAHRMLRVHAASLGLDAGFGVLDAGDASDLLGMVRQEEGHAESSRRFPRPGTLQDIYSGTVNAQRPLTEILAERFPWCEEHREALAAIFRAYGAQKRKLGVLDLDDLLLYWKALLANDVIGPRIAGAFDHLLVDEYQDVNGLQVDIVRKLHEGCPGLTVVGDDFQAIYGFRSASARHILEFPDQFPGSHVVKLEQNYRSTAPILAVANAVAEQDRDGYRKTLWTEREGGTTPELCFPRDEAEQARAVCERVLAAREEGTELREQAVVYRTNHDPALLEVELRRRDIPFVKYGGLKYLEAGHVKDFVALLRLADNHADELSWLRVLQLLDGVAAGKARKILDASWQRRRGCAAARAVVGGCRARSAELARAGERCDRSTAEDWRRLCARHGGAGRATMRGDQATDPPALPRRCLARVRPRPACAGCPRRAGHPAFRWRARARSAVIERGLRWTSTPGRGLPCAEQRTLVEGPRVGDGASDRRIRRQLPGRHGDRQRGGDRRGAAPLLCRPHASTAPATRVCAGALLPPAAWSRRHSRHGSGVAVLDEGCTEPVQSDWRSVERAQTSSRGGAGATD
jgi:hypothetical protein